MADQRERILTGAFSKPPAWSSLSAAARDLVQGLLTVDASKVRRHCLVVVCCVLCSAVRCSAVRCCAVLCCAVLCCAVLCCAVLCCAVLCCAVLCCAAFVALSDVCCDVAQQRLRCEDVLNHPWMSRGTSASTTTP
jgi:hypothetical protein